MRKPKIQPKISLLIPFSSNNEHRRRVFEWLLAYWDNELPEAEIVIGYSRSSPFCKTEALNNAAKKANGKVLVVLDADAYISGSIINDGVDLILDELENHLWLVPYRNLYRLNEQTTLEILDSDPVNPLRLSDPPPQEDLDAEPNAAKYGRAYAALAYIIPREALDVLRCWDERFQGWGGEDISTLRALDTLYGKHKTTDNGIFHLWHPKIGSTFRTRAWEGQTSTEPNKQLALSYSRANNNLSAMRDLVDEGCSLRDQKLEKGIIWEGFDDWFLNILSELTKRNRKKFY